MKNRLSRNPFLRFKFNVITFTFICQVALAREETEKQGMVWKWEWKFGMEYGRCQNGMKWKIFKNGMEDNLPYFHTNSILDFRALQLQKKTIPYRCRVVINNIAAEVFSLQYLPVLFVDKSWYFGCVYCADSVRIALQ